MAKFLQQTLDEMAVTGKGHSSKAAKDFVEFFEKLSRGSLWANNDGCYRKGSLDDARGSKELAHG
ncbi:letm1 and EF-hand domain-containing protein 1, mitochondrial [Homalodisca vitripennis]|nr:letm1 and EF-hand domain-containing protein 1, mitochondrial [Homalodisca vitripennis]